MKRSCALLFAVIACMGMISSGASEKKEQPAWNRVLVLNVQDDLGQMQRIGVGLTESAYLLKPDGVQVQYYTPDEGLRIVQALEEAGIRNDRTIIAALLGNTAPGNRVPDGKADQAVGLPDAGVYCLTLKIRDSGGSLLDTVVVGLEGGYVTHALHPQTGERFRRFSLNDALAIKQALFDRGHGWERVANTLLGLTTYTTDTTPMLIDDGGDDSTCGPCRREYCSLGSPPSTMNCAKTCGQGGSTGCELCDVCSG